MTGSPRDVEAPNSPPRLNKHFVELQRTCLYIRTASKKRSSLVLLLGGKGRVVGLLWKAGRKTKQKRNQTPQND